MFLAFLRSPFYDRIVRMTQYRYPYYGSDSDNDSDNQYSKLLDKLDISNVVEQVENAVYNIGHQIYNNCSRIFNRINENIENNLEMFKVRYPD